MKNIRKAILIAAAVAAGCGGGSDNDEDTPLATVVPSPTPVESSPPSSPSPSPISTASPPTPALPGSPQPPPAGTARPAPVGSAQITPIPRPPPAPEDATQPTPTDGDAQQALDISPVVPTFLQTAFIEMTSAFTATTYDFVQQQAAGRQTMEIRNWQRIGSLGWQSNQQFTADYEANNELVVFVSPSGFADRWTFVAVGPQGMDVIDSAGRVRNLFNCTAPGWPTLIAFSTRSCSGF